MSLVEKINKFDGTENAFLSNFYPFPILYNNLVFPTSEHLYQAMKMTNDDDVEKIRKAKTPAKAKKLGNTLPIVGNWNDIKLQVMEITLRTKFNYPEMKEKLLATGDKDLEEGNTWGDKFWGTVDGKGENWLGKLLMKIRNQLKE